MSVRRMRNSAAFQTLCKKLVLGFVPVCWEAFFPQEWRTCLSPESLILMLWWPSDPTWWLVVAVWFTGASAAGEAGTWLLPDSFPLQWSALYTSAPPHSPDNIYRSEAAVFLRTRQSWLLSWLPIPHQGAFSSLGTGPGTDRCGRRHTYEPA